MIETWSRFECDGCSWKYCAKLSTSYGEIAKSTRYTKIKRFELLFDSLIDVDDKNYGDKIKIENNADQKWLFSIKNGLPN